MSKKVNKNALANLSDSDSSSEVVAPKKKTVAPKRKVSDSSSESVSMLKQKQKRKPSKEQKKKVAVADSDSDSESLKKPKKPVKKVAKKVDSDSDSESEVVKKSTKKPSKKVQSDSESDEEVDTPMKNLNKTETADDGETHKEVFMRNLSYKSTEDSLWEYLSQFGTLVALRLLTERDTGRSRGIGFAEFQTRKEAQNAIDNCGEVDGRTPALSFSNIKPDRNNNNNSNGKSFGNNNNRGGNGGFQKSDFQGDVHTIFVGNLGFRTNEMTIKNFFNSCGSVVDVRIAKDRDTGKAKGFCHVDFESSDAIEKAKALAGQSLDGREIRVDGSNPRTGGSGGFGGNRGGSRGGFRGGRGGNRGGPPRQSHVSGGNHQTFSDSD